MITRLVWFPIKKEAWIEGNCNYKITGECLAKNMIKEANLSNSFSDSSQMMLKLGRNIRWVEIL